MTTGHKWFIGLVATIFIAIGALFFAIRYHDGPMEIISGGPFTSGQVVPGETDWSFIKDHQTIEMQTMVPPRSRTMWTVVIDDRLFVISSYMNTVVGKLWKKWPHTIEEDNRADIRIDGKIYQMKLNRIMEGDVVEPVLARFTEKYGIQFEDDVLATGSSWLFELTPR